ncbi:hypothetical protein LAZ67_3006144 [Cordylochernes scorpioides]|uniref:Reverse transcriptase domain-containing protein n=1 Tax=Cordylochernes scorpioides TaxID=51811 RepID=A0ABY6KAX8_9ARAC|nr:hypothetical protein LAZ67_3006144 [Cordylochernes scorpioides]
MTAMADDIVLIGESMVNLQEKINRLKTYLDANYLTLNEAKSKIITPGYILRMETGGFSLGVTSPQTQYGQQPGRHAARFTSDPRTLIVHLTSLGTAPSELR